MYELRKTFRFEAAHRLPLHEGKCHRLHGHSFRGTVYLKGEEVAEGGMLVDFGIVGALVEVMTKTKLDHFYLNESLEMQSPTAELIAKWCFEWLQRTEIAPFLAAVEIEETCTAAATYRRRL